MITVFFNEDGYYVTGEGVGVARRCSPALTEQGDPIFQSAHHTYKVLYEALCELRDMSVMEDVMVYNDSRIIDEVNGTIDTMDATCADWLKTLKRVTIPSIRSVVFFRKKPTTQIKTTIAAAHKDMLSDLDTQEQQALAERMTKTRTAQAVSRKQRLVNRFRKSWFGDNNAQRKEN